MLADETGFYHLGQVVVWIIHLYFLHLLLQDGFYAEVMEAYNDAFLFTYFQGKFFYSKRHIAIVFSANNFQNVFINH